MSDDSHREALEKSIIETEANLARLDAELREARQLLEAQRGALVQIVETRVEPAVGTTAADQSRQTTSDKIALFRSLFRGRIDVFPRLWKNARTGKHGYAPACANEWVRGVCEKPRVKCGECPNQAFFPVDDRVILDHLLGHHIVGLYPLLPDETCWLLAIDFDKAAWADDVIALRRTCEDLDVPVAVERSRSGNGAHAWFFFTESVPAGVARRMGSYLLTETMSRRHELGMGSYDRLFPNQDTMPRGGFGNLIALPFQSGPRKAGNTVFLDEQMIPHPDQWAFLTRIQKMTPEKVGRIAEEAHRRGMVVGVRAAVLTDDDADRTPWDRPPNRRPEHPPISEPLPPSIRAVLAQRLFVEKAGLPPSLLNQIKRLAAFQNPEFYKRQNMRLSTALTPRVIACAEDLTEHLALPRGCLTELEKLLAQYCVRLVLEDRRAEGSVLDVAFQGSLTDAQRLAVRSLLPHEQGVFSAPPGVGKTVVGISLIAHRARSTLVLVHRRPLLDQWIAQLSIFFGVAPHEIGTIGAGKNSPNGRLDVAMLQSLIRGGSVASIVADYGHVVVDECHHVPAVSFERVMQEVKARFITGLTATPHRRDGHEPILEMQLGPVRHRIDPRAHGAVSPFVRRLILRETDFRLPALPSMPPIQEIYRLLARDDARNALIIDDVIAAVEEGRSPLVLTERRDHLEFLAGELSKAIRNVLVLQGGMADRIRRDNVTRLIGIPLDEERVVLATGRFAGEGFDDPRLDTLFLVLPISWKGTLTQYAGRLHRLLPDKTEVRIYDYVDSEEPVLQRMFEKRLKGYRAIGYEVDVPASVHG